MSNALLAETTTVRSKLAELEETGFTHLPDLVPPETLQSMQHAFATRLKRMRWNDYDGYEKTEPFRHMVQDVLMLDQGFLDLALHPLVKSILREYLGDGFALVEAKGWLSLPTPKDFHGWHGDAWYDQAQIHEVPREVKLAFYLTDVKSGAFTYLKGTHHKTHPRGYRNEEVSDIPKDQIIEVLAPAGSGFLFDTSGIHRQTTPILDPRQAIFLNYHDPRYPLQQEDIDYYRYHPLLLNAAYLGNLDHEDRKILGFGDKRHYSPAFERKSRDPAMHALLSNAYDSKLKLGRLSDRVQSRLRKQFARKSR